MLYFTRWKALAIILTALVVCLFAVPNFFPQERVKTWPAWAQRHIVLGLDLQGGTYLLLEIDANAVKKEKIDQVRDEIRRVLREAKIGYTGLASRVDSAEVRVKDTDLPTALSKLRELSQPLGGLVGSSGQRSLEVSDAGGGLIPLTGPPGAPGGQRPRWRLDPPDGAAGRDHRTSPAGDRAVDPDRRTARQCDRYGRADHSAARCRSNSAAGAGPAGSDRAQTRGRPDRQDGIPHGRSVDIAGSGPAGTRAGRLGSPDERGVAEGALRRQEAGAGFRRRPHRCPAGLRPAHQRTDRQFQVQQRGLAQIRAGDVGECRRAVCDHPRQQGDLC